MFLSPCIEWLFADQHSDLPGRIRAAKAAGVLRVVQAGAVCFWPMENLGKATKQ